MAATLCPVCNAANQRIALRCAQCGADFSDPDVRAMMSSDGGAHPPLELDAGALVSDKFLWFSGARLADGSALKALGLLGGILGLLAFVWPLSPTFGATTMPWRLDGISPLALYLPGAAFALGLVLFFVKVPTKLAAGLLAATGLAGLLFGLAPLGRIAASGEHNLPLWISGLALAGAAAVARLHRPNDPLPRYALIAAALLGLAALALPIEDAARALPGEFRLMLHPSKLANQSLASAAAAGAGHDMMVRFLALWILFGGALLVATPALAWNKAGGPWDKLSLFLRPMAWTLVLFVPLFFALQVFNVAGWTGPSYAYYENTYVQFDDFTSSVMLARARLFVSAVGYTLWCSLGAYALYAQLMAGRSQGDRVEAG